jgi:hypothetical protein
LLFDYMLEILGGYLEKGNFIQCSGIVEYCCGCLQI